MKIRIPLAATTLTAFFVLATNCHAQTPPKATTFVIAGHTGEAQLLQVNRKSYVEVEALTRLTKGKLSFDGSKTILTLPSADAGAQPRAPNAKAGLSLPFVRAAIEEISLIREWRSAVVGAVQKNSPLSEDWLATQRRLADKSLALASAAVSTDDDRSAFPLLSTELSNMLTLNEHYRSMRTQVRFISTDTFHSTPLEEQILACAQGFTAMTEKLEFHDHPACH